MRRYDCDDITSRSCKMPFSWVVHESFYVQLYSSNDNSNFSAVRFIRVSYFVRTYWKTTCWTVTNPDNSQTQTTLDTWPVKCTTRFIWNYPTIRVWFTGEAYVMSWNIIVNTSFANTIHILLFIRFKINQYVRVIFLYENDIYDYEISVIHVLVTASLDNIW
jgi:hypothetical protein